MSNDKYKNFQELANNEKDIKMRIYNKIRKECIDEEIESFNELVKMEIII